MQTIFNADFSPPRGLETSDFVIFPTDPGYSEPDYEAVMASRRLLRIWSDSEWPEDDFTVEQNREDLGLHVDDNVRHTAYGYMIFNPDRTRCYGSVYVNPLEGWENRYDLLDGKASAVQHAQARIDYWVSEADSELEAPILAALRDWFRTEWKIRVLYVARPQMLQRIETYKAAGLQLQAHIRAHDGGTEALLFGPEA